ncbi:unnamed protein product [Effrenium voratum]|uniref:Dihydrolipoamide acetyltransferase component of pyruvate dehydrogenase complex n=1 Tax=Effrenium voratum TaxID=2562239 RepID=A0AA36I354_9DINO|nr:unnamed protein product [Effrenium voratum]
MAVASIPARLLRRLPVRSAAFPLRNAWHLPKEVRCFRTSPSLLALQKFKLADIGEGIAEVQLTEWFVKEGDMVKEMDNVCSVESDKASVELTSPYTGKVVKVHHKVQDTVKVGSVLIEVETGDSASASTPAPTPTPAPAASAPAASSGGGGGGVQTFKLADIGEGIAEVQLTEWFVKEGDMVKEMDNVCSVESDKASVELTSPYTGKIVKVHHKVQDTVKVGSALIDVETGAGGASASAPAPTPTPAASAPAASGGGGGGGVQQFKLADIGEGIAEVQLTEWFVKEGDMVKEMDNVCSVESDKASVELTSPYTGKIVKVHHKVQDTVKVGSVLIDVETGAGSAPAAAAPTPSAPAPTPAAPAAAPAPKAAAAPSAGGGTKAPGVLATPKVRGLARQMGIDLNSVQGSGANGRVLESDLQAAPAPKASAAAASPAKAASAPRAAPAARSLEDQVVQITDNVGKGMVKSMQASLSVPYMALGEEIDMTEILKMQKQLKEVALKKYGTKITVTSFMLKAISLALIENPKVNSKFGPADANPPSYTIYGSHNISVAVDTPNGLMVPNIKDVANKNVMEIQDELMRVAQAAQQGKLAMSDIQGGTITLSNIGVIGTKDPRPILFDGQAVIGATGRTMTLPRYNAKMDLVPRQVMNIRWVGDHRHLDGAGLARFSNSFKAYMENPGEWCLTMR